MNSLIQKVYILISLTSAFQKCGMEYFRLGIRRNWSIASPKIKLMNSLIKDVYILISVTFPFQKYTV